LNFDKTFEITNHVHLLFMCIHRPIVVEYVIFPEVSELERY